MEKVENNILIRLLMLNSVVSRMSAIIQIEQIVSKIQNIIKEDGKTWPRDNSLFCWDQQWLHWP